MFFTLSRSSVVVVIGVWAAVESVTMRNDSAPAESETSMGVGSPSELEPSSLPWESVRSLICELLVATPGMVKVKVSDSCASKNSTLSSSSSDGEVVTAGSTKTKMFYLLPSNDRTMKSKMKQKNKTE